MEFKGTKGNFRIKYVSGFLRIVDEDGNNVIDTPWKHLNEANAKLIVSAPEMFEMLKDILDSNSPDLKDIRQLLTKITE